jgi:hypothetical protein
MLLVAIIPSVLASVAGPLLDVSDLLTLSFRPFSGDGQNNQWENVPPRLGT